jgi:predicted DNA-binding transcriptional regulator AlpA
MHDTHLLGFQELAATLAISKQNARKHLARPDFPPPVARLACGPVWSATDVAAYLERRLRR